MLCSGVNASPSLESVESAVEGRLLTTASASAITVVKTILTREGRIFSLIFSTSLLSARVKIDALSEKSFFKLELLAANLTIAFMSELATSFITTSVCTAQD